MRFAVAEFSCPLLDDIAQRLGGSAKFYSQFFQPVDPLHDYPNFSRGYRVVLAEVLNSAFFQETFSDFCPLDPDAPKQFSILNTFEFEGSLIEVLMAGTCTEIVCRDENEARDTSRALVNMFLADPHRILVAYRADQCEWSRLSSGATITWTYIVYIVSRKMWWFASLVDDY